MRWALRMGATLPVPTRTFQEAGPAKTMSDSEDMGHAVVLGAGIGGLLATRALADFHDRVTVLERDELAAEVGQRKGIPQGQHFHTLLRRGGMVLDELFPGLSEELIDAGVPTPGGLDVRIILSGHELSRVDTGVRAIQLTRPMLEHAIRARVTGIPHVKIVDGQPAVGLVSSGERITGVRVAGPSREEILDADLVVDATGRSGRSTTWLTELGYPAPAEDRITVDMRYVSQMLRLAPGTIPPDPLTLIGPVPGRTRGLALAAQEGDRWLLTAIGLAGDHPSVDRDALLGFVKTVAPPEVYAAVRDAEPLSEPRSNTFPASIRRRYERLTAFPAGLLVFGDAICSFNPIYGQGMTVAAIEAELLRSCLRDGSHELAPRFFSAAAKAIEPAWRLAAGGDLRLPEIQGHRPLMTKLINRYVGRLHRVAAHDTVVSAAFRRVSGLIDPPATILSPRILLRVLLGGRRTGR
jgi:2-polyprenyl-6-methoxyphenol hydroxylase-like FAD-dependent oxidoreductase